MIEAHDLEGENKTTSYSLDIQAQFICFLPLTHLLEINHRIYEEKQSMWVCCVFECVCEYGKMGGGIWENEGDYDSEKVR